ncbi:hypothetical protein OSB04_006095 [Centaurea solstitialis]|uniref:Uncharacterized protein n=1 Tax=Centaurea solstitialis TaxID=347529 RepID=A0AA38TTY8_9ASTR|nr:hypothetical protein OSB04_006095 [Centaurea solstitialis]
MVENYISVQFTDDGEVVHPSADSPPFVSSYNDKIRPILDAVDNLRRLKITEEGIPLPTIVVVVDQSCGKSSVLESLACISLPHGHGICTRVPLIMRLQHHSDPVPEFLLQFQGKVVPINAEGEICEAIGKATEEIAGDRKGISNVPLTLIVKKKGVPDLTMVDLPGITQVLVHDQPLRTNLRSQPGQVILFVALCLDGTHDGLHRRTQIQPEPVKPSGRALVVVGGGFFLFEQEVHEYVFVVKELRYGNGAHKGRRKHHLERSFCVRRFFDVRINSYSRRVDPTGQRTLAVVTKCNQSPDDLFEKVTSNDVNISLDYICIRNRINNARSHPIDNHIEMFAGYRQKDQREARCFGFGAQQIAPEACEYSQCNGRVIQMVGSLKETLQKILIRGEFDEYVDDKQMHCNARLIEMLDEYSTELRSSVKFSDNFLVDEMEVLEEANRIRLPHFASHSAFLLWGYLENVFMRVLVDHYGSYPQLLPSIRKSTHSMMSKMKKKFLERVIEMIEMEKLMDYTCDPNFNATWKKLMGDPHEQFDKVIREYNYRSSGLMSVEGYEYVNIKHLVSVSENVREQVFDLKMRMTAYWEIVLKRMVDWVALQIQFLIKQMVNNEMRTEIVNEVMVNDGGIEKMMDEPSSIAAQRERLRKSIDLLQESKEVLGQVIDGILTADWRLGMKTRCFICVNKNLD